MAHYQHKFRRQAGRWVRPTRTQLHVERLEDRLLMSATSSASANVPLNLAKNSSAALFGPRDLRQAIASIAAPFGKFQSTAQLQQWLIRAAVAEYGSLFGQSTYNYGWNGLGYVTTTGGVASNSTTGPTVDAGGAFSSTNVQVPGVDEADLVETDGHYLYIISGQDLVIVQAGAAGDMQIASRVHLDQAPSGMYLSGDRLALVSDNSSQSYGGIAIAQPLMLVANGFQYRGWQPTPPKTTLTVFDVSNRAAPAVVQKTELDGQLVGSRVVNGELRLVLANQFDLPMPISRPLPGPMPVWPTLNPRLFQLAPAALPVDSVTLSLDGVTGGVATTDVSTGWWSYQPSTTYAYETQAEYLARVGDQLLAAIQPKLRSIAPDGSVISETPLFNPTDLYQPDSLLDRFVTTVAMFDLQSNHAGPVSTASVLSGSPAQVYATQDSVYLFAASSPAAGMSIWGSPAAAASTVWKFSIDSQTHAVSLAATGEFSGTITNQFNADEQNGYLRVVSTGGAWSDNGQNVFVLKQVGDQLRVVGSLTGIAAGEALHSVRFEGNRVFICTFRNFDPLFAVDLSNPTNPQMLGELQIPGYSDYLQPIDANHLLAIGRDVDATTGEYGQLQVSLFDVSDSAHPQLLDRYSFAGGSTTQTPALGTIWSQGGDYHALSYFESQHLLALPIYSDAGWSFGAGDQTPLLQPGQGGLELFQLDNSGIRPIGLVKNDSLVERSVTIGDQLYVISDETVSAHALDNPTVPIETIRIGTDDVAPTSGDVPLQLFKLPQQLAPTATQTPAVLPMPGIQLHGVANQQSVYGPMPKLPPIAD